MPLFDHICFCTITFIVIVATKSFAEQGRQIAVFRHELVFGVCEIVAVFLAKQAE